MIKHKLEFTDRLWEDCFLPIRGGLCIFMNGKNYEILNSDELSYSVYNFINQK